MMPPPALMNHLWQSTLLAIAIWLATLALRRNAARVRYWLWAAASIKFLVPLSALVSLGERFQWRSAPVMVQPAVSFVMEDVLAPVTVVAATPAQIPHSTAVWPWLLVALWCSGAGVVLLTWWRQWRPIRAALGRATPLGLAPEYGAIDLVVMSSPSMPEPGVIGIWRPRLLLPEGLVERLTPPQLRALIAHERCHIRCQDNLAAAIHMAVEALFWFHPIVWWIETRLVDERERACDEAVLRAGSEPRDYAEGLLEVCRQSVGSRLACVAGVSGSNLRARVEAIMRHEIGRPLTPARRGAVAAAIIVAVGGPIAAGAFNARSQVVVPMATVPLETISITRTSPRPGIGPIEHAMVAHVLRDSMSRARDGRLRVEGPLHVLIQAAYGVTGFQVEGGPSWVASDRYGIEARAAGNPRSEEIPGMLQSLLADRFKLVLRRETRTLPVYELVVAGGGPRIAAMKDGDCIPRDKVRWDLIDLEAPLLICNMFGRRTLSQSPETRPRPRWPRVDRIQAGGISMAALIDVISGDVDRVIVDRTGFAERFNVVLDFAAVRQTGPPSSGPTIFAALEEQLGLRLQPASDAVEVLVIDRVERPAVN